MAGRGRCKVGGGTGPTGGRDGGCPRKVPSTVETLPRGGRETATVEEALWERAPVGSW